MNKDVIQAFTRTSYWVETGDHRICLRVGEPSSALDEVLAPLGVTDWAYVTAYNPASVKLSCVENEARHNNLIQDVQAMGYQTLLGEGCGDTGDWPPEPSVLILGISLEAARRIGTTYGQTAILVGRRNEAPRLSLCADI